MREEQYAQQNTARLEKILKTSSEDGLSSAEATKRLEKDGINPVLPAEKSPFLSFLLQILKNGSLPLFLLALVLVYPLLLGSVILPAALYLLFLCAFLLLSVKSYYGMRRHQRSMLPYVRVIRDGKERLLSPEHLVRGDLLHLSKGDILYAYAHITTDDEMTVFCTRETGSALFTKHGGDCFDGSEEPFNCLCPGDAVRDGDGYAFVTFQTDCAQKNDYFVSQTEKNHGKMCAMTTRVSFCIAFFVLLAAFLRTCFTKDYVFLAEALLLSATLIATAGTCFFKTLFDLLFLYKNKRMKEQNDSAYASVKDLEKIQDIDSFVFSTRSLFRAAQYSVRYFETAGGKRISGKGCATAELSLIANAFLAMKKRCAPGMEEQAILDFSSPYITTRDMDIYAKATEGGRTLASYHSSHDGRSFSLVFGDAEQLIPQLIYFSEEGKTRLLDAKWRSSMLKGTRRLRANGYRIILVAETQTRVSPGGMPSPFSDLKLLGFFALRKVSDIQAIKTLTALEKEAKKVFFIHDGEDADWLKKEIKCLADVPVLDGRHESFREELMYYIEVSPIPFFIGIHLNAVQKAQIVHFLEKEGHHVAAYGETFDDHRMMCGASISMAPHKTNCREMPALVADAAALRVGEHISSQVEAVRRSHDPLGTFGLLTAAICTSLLGRCMVVLIGILFGKAVLSAGYIVLLGVFFDFLAFYCFTKSKSQTKFDGLTGLIEENERNLSLFAAYLIGAFAVGGFAAYVAFHPASFAFSAGSFVFVSLLFMLNVGMWSFTSAVHSIRALLFPSLSLLLTAIIFVTGYVTDGKLGFIFCGELFWWALFAVSVLLAAGKLIQFYFKRKNIVKIGEKNERV